MEEPRSSNREDGVSSALRTRDGARTRTAPHRCDHGRRRSSQGGSRRHALHSQQLAQLVSRRRAAQATTPAHPPTAQPPPIVATAADGRPLPLPRSFLGAATASDVRAHYDLTDTVLGAGAFATTRLARDRAGGARVAVKSILKSKLLGLSPEWADARREVQVMLHLAGEWEAQPGGRGVGQEEGPHAGRASPGW